MVVDFKLIYEMSFCQNWWKSIALFIELNAADETEGISNFQWIWDEVTGQFVASHC